jgi:hypothetical protein
LFSSCFHISLLRFSWPLLRSCFSHLPISVEIKISHVMFLYHITT